MPRVADPCETYCSGPFQISCVMEWKNKLFELSVTLKTFELGCCFWTAVCLLEGGHEGRCRRKTQNQALERRMNCLHVLFWGFFFQQVWECTQRYSVVHTLADVTISSAESQGLISCYRICSHLGWSHWVNVWHDNKRADLRSNFC